MTTEPLQMRLLFAQPPYAMGANGRLHWGRKARLVKAKRTEARLVTLAALRQYDCFFGFTPRVYDVYWYYARGVEPDEDNVLSRCKALLDGCADALGVNDRTWHLGQIHRIKLGTKDPLAGCVELVFYTPLPTAADNSLVTPKLPEAAAADNSLVTPKLPEAAAADNSLVTPKLPEAAAADNS